MPARLDTAVLGCLRDGARTAAERGDAVVLRLTGPLSAEKLADAELAQAHEAFADRRFAVVLPGGPSGVGGAMLLLLASGPEVRGVPADASLPRLDEAAVRQLENVGACDDLCKALGAGELTGAQAVERGFARPAGAVTVLGVPAVGESGDSGAPAWLWAGFGLAAAAALVLGAGYMRARRSPGFAVAPGIPGAVAAVVPERPGGRPVPAGAVRRTATVRTRLHPEGYVELDDCLVRATWADSAAPPEPGGMVDTVLDENGELLAVRTTRGTKNSGRPHGR